MPTADVWVSLRSVMRGTLLWSTLAIALGGCDHDPATGPAANSAAAWPDPEAAATDTPRVAEVEDVSEIAAPRRTDGAALAAIVEAAPEVDPRPTAPDGDTAIGSETGVTEDARERLEAAPRQSTVRGGEVQIQPQVSSPAIERQARAQIYWPLRRCKGPDGRPPPPESITLAFTLREDGSVDPASVAASAVDPALQPTAECVLRAFSATPFQGPQAARRAPARIVITWPSVD